MCSFVYSVRKCSSDSICPMPIKPLRIDLREIITYYCPPSDIHARIHQRSAAVMLSPWRREEIQARRFVKWSQGYSLLIFCHYFNCFWGFFDSTAGALLYSVVYFKRQVHSLLLFIYFTYNWTKNNFLL